MDGNDVPRAFSQREGHGGIGTCFKLTDSPTTSGKGPEHSSVLLGGFHRGRRLALIALLVREIRGQMQEPFRDVYLPFTFCVIWGTPLTRAVYGPRRLLDPPVALMCPPPGIVNE
jgi:hypothetical protein